MVEVAHCKTSDPQWSDGRSAPLPRKSCQRQQDESDHHAKDGENSDQCCQQSAHAKDVERKKNVANSKVACRQTNARHLRAQRE